jgi:hypothetical protein
MLPFKAGVLCIVLMIDMHAAFLHVQLITGEPVEAWPLCDVMLSWHSEGFPPKRFCN